MYDKEIRSYIISTCLVCLACLLHGLDFYGYLSFPIHSLVFALYAFVIFIWMINMRKRVLRSAVADRFKFMAILMICYLAARTVKYEVLIENDQAVNFIRYLYFVFPLVLIQLVFLTSLHISKSERENISKFWNLLWIPSGISCLLIISNSYHGLVFSLDPTAKGLFQYGPVYYFVIIYIGSLALMTIGFTMVYSQKNSQLYSAILPIMIMLLWASYTFLYMVGWESFEYVKIIFKSAEFNILMVILFVESLVFMRLLPSNRGYESFLQTSSLNIGIMDRKGQIIFTPSAYKNIKPSLINQALEAPIQIDENTILESAPIQGGISFYFIDLSDFNKLKKKLLALSEEMLNENELIKAKNTLKHNMVKLEEQREIRDYIYKKLQPQFDQLSHILMDLPEDEEAFEIKLKHACFIDVYIKRYSNLFLLSKNKEKLDLAELKLAFAESLDYLQLSRVASSMDWQISGSFDGKYCLILYEIFQDALEFYMPGISSVHLRSFMDDGNPQLLLHIEKPQAESFLAACANTYSKSGIMIKEEIKDDSISLWIFYEGGTYDPS